MASFPCRSRFRFSPQGRDSLSEKSRCAGDLYTPGMTRGVRHSEKVAAEVLERLAEGESLRKICRDSHIPSFRAAIRCAIKDREGFRARYDAARECLALAHFDDLIELAAGAADVATGAPGTGEATAPVHAVKLREDALKWRLARLLPKHYGERISQEISGPDGGPIQTETEFRITPEDEAFLKRVADARALIVAEQAE